MKKVFLLLFVLGLTISFSAVGPATVSAAKKSKSLTIRFGTDLPPHLPPAIGMHWWAEAVTKATDGRVKVQMYPASSLSTSAAALQNLLSGVCDMYMLSTSVHRKAFPVCSLLGLPGVGFPDDTLEANTAHMNTFFELVRKFPAAAEEFSDFADPFFYVIYSESYIISKGVKIRVPTDVKGIKVGCNGARMELMDRLGAASVTDIPPTAYEKLQTGVTQASMVAVSAAHDFQLAEVTDYILDVPFGGGGHPVVVNKQTWQKISPEDQKIMKELAPEGSKRSHIALADLTTLSWKEMDDKGMTVKATPEEKKLWEKEFKVQWEEWIAQNEAAGVKDAREILNWWKSTADKEWNK